MPWIKSRNRIKGFSISRPMKSLWTNCAITGSMPAICSTLPNQVPNIYGKDSLKPTWIRETLPLMKEVQSLMKAAGHQPVNRDDPSYLSFLQTTLVHMNRLSEMHPFLDFNMEKERMEIRA